MSFSHSRRGFTLIEVIVVIAIIGVLVGLLLPALSRVQEIAQQTSCRNNLKQMGLALQGYHHAHRTFPSAYLFKPDDEPPSGFKGVKTSPGWGWGTLLLPHIEQVNLYQQIDLKKNIEDKDFKFQRTRRIGVYECPSDQNVGVFTVVDEKVKEEGGLGAPIAECYTNSYAANFGAGPQEIGEAPSSGDGVFFCNSAITMRDIRDGVSNTMAIGERAADWAQAPWAGAISCGIIQNGVPDPAVDTKESAWMEEAPVQVMAGFGALYCSKLNGPKSNAYCFYTPHPNPKVANFVFTDGAVHPISTNTSYSVLKALSTRDGGEAVGANDY